jgi:SAM-dependent methyltransferase
MEKIDTTDSEEARKALLEVYEAGEVYKAETICLRPDEADKDYAGELLTDKISIVRKFARPGLLVDLCCGSGEHLFAMADLSGRAIGIDFCRPFVAEARKRANDRGFNHVEFIEGDAFAIPFERETIDTLYSFSALYALPEVNKVFTEIGRVLKPGGICVLDLGNSRSINTYCLKYYPEIPPSFHISLWEMKQFIEDAGLRVLEWRSYQLLPLWAGKPKWLWPILHPFWKSVMKARIRGKMMDEWISSAPLLRKFAFRNVIVCEKL